MTKVAKLAGLAAAAWFVRRQLVHLLTRYTGTWIGTPDA